MVISAPNNPGKHFGPLHNQAITNLNFNFHCISAPNHSGKDFDPPTIKQIPIWTSIFTAQVPQTILASILTPPQSSKCPFELGQEAVELEAGGEAEAGEDLETENTS